MDVVDEVHSVLEQIKKFTDMVREGEVTGYTGKQLRNIVSVGIGGSYLGERERERERERAMMGALGLLRTFATVLTNRITGPEFLHECLKTEPEGVNAALGYTLRFLSNVDPVDVERTCSEVRCF